MMEEYNDSQYAKNLSARVWMRLLPYFKKMKKNMLLLLLLMLASAGIEASYPLFTRFAVNTFVIPEQTRGIVGFAFTFFAFILLESVTVVFFSKQSMTVDVGISRLIRRDCFTHLQQLPLSFYSKSSVGYLVARVMSDTERISATVSWGLSHVAWNLCYVLFTIIYMFILNPRLAVILVAIVPIVAVITWLFEARIIIASRKVREINSRITGAYNEGITGSKTSKTLVIEDVNCREFGELTGGMYRESIRVARLSAVMLPLVYSCGALAVAAVLFRGGVLVRDSMLDAGSLSAFIAYAVGMIEPVVQIAGVITDMVAAQVGIERVTALLGEPLTITDAPEITEKYGGTFDPKPDNWEPIKGEITFENVWFKYPDGEDYILEDFNLTVPAGTTVAIVGETGAGKSTIVNLACRFFEPTEGRVLIDGVDYRERSQLWLHSSLGYVLQDPHLFSGTIAENIRYGRPDATDDDIRAAAKLVSADVVAERMPEGYEADVGEGGDKLSTGEKQLVSFARAIIANPPIFVLDEATSSIDTETERLIQNAISHILTGRTSFIIAHRLSTISRADIILVVEDGKVVERGTHDELLRAGGHYSALHRAMRIDGITA